MEIKLDINEKNLLFIDVPEIYKNFEIVNYEFAGTYIMETDSVGLNHWKMNIPKGNYEIIGFSKDVILDETRTNKNFILRKI